MSVYRSDVIMASDGEVARVLKGHDAFKLSAITAGFARSLGQTVHPDPLPEEEAHAVVCGKKTKGTQRALVKQARWVQALEG